MEPSGGGRFEVTLDDKPIFEKSRLGRHERAGEIMTLIAERLAKAESA